MKRPTSYTIAFGMKFSRATWNELARVLPAFGAHWCNPQEYTHSSHGVHDNQPFTVWRADHKPLTKDEIGALSFFFAGVLATLGVTPPEKIDTLSK